MTFEMLILSFCYFLPLKYSGSIGPNEISNQNLRAEQLSNLPNKIHHFLCRRLSQLSECRMPLNQNNT